MTLENKEIKDENYSIILNSEYFDEEWYSSNYDLEGHDAAFHYLYIGFKKGFNPSPIFNTIDYYEYNPDVENNGMNPLLHYELYGCKEGRIWKKSQYVSVNDELCNYYMLNSNKQRILLVGHDCYNAGAEILLKNIISELKKSDVEVAVLVKKSGPLFEDYKKMAPTFVIDSIKKIRNYIRELSKYGFKSAILNTVVTGDLIPVLHDYGFYTISLVHELPKAIKFLNAKDYGKIISEQSDFVVFPSTFVAEKFEELSVVKGKKLIHPQGLYNSYNNFNYLKSRKRLEEKHNIPSENNIILNVGTGTLIKGFDLFLEVSKKLNGENYSFIWLGSIDEKIKEKYCNGFDNENIVFPGFIDDIDELMDYYGACDLLMLTSREDPFPSVVLESFNAKKPVVAFEDAGGFKDIVINNETGFLVEYESVDEMIEKIKLICNDNDLKEKLGNNAKEICGQYDFSNYVKLLILCCNHGEELLALKNDIKLKNQKIVDIKTINRDKDNLISTQSSLNKKKNTTISNLKAKNKKLTNNNKKLTSKNKELRKQNKELLNSTSWKLTKPLRKVKSKIKSPSNDANKEVVPKNNALKEETLKKEKKYSFIHTYPYAYKIYISPENLKRVNLFFYNLDNDIYKLKNLFSFVIKYCNKFGYDLRIVYRTADFDLLNHFLEINGFKLPENTTFLNLKNNYLEISLSEKNICTSWITAKRLLKAKALNSIIYFYLDDLNEYIFEDSFKVSNVCYNNNVVILNDDVKKLDLLRNYYFDYDMKINRKLNEDTRILCCDFGDMIIEGIELLNYLFSNKILDINQWDINIIGLDKISREYLDANKNIKHVSEKLEDYDLFLKFVYDSSDEMIEDNCIRLFIKEVSDENYNCLSILNNDFEMFDKFTPLKSHSKLFLQIGEIFNKINEAN